MATIRKHFVGSVLCTVCLWAAVAASAQTADQQQPKSNAAADKPAEKPKPRIRPNDAGSPIPTRAELLRGAYGPFRANNDLLYYHLDIRIDPERKFLSGKNTIRFRMLKDGTRIQLDLTDALAIDKILLGDTALKYDRDGAAVFVNFPHSLHAGQIYSIDFYYSGNPPETGRFGGFTFKRDPSGHVWINTACEESGASVWWPNKDQWRDEVESMDISVAIPSDLVDVSNGKFIGKTDLGDGYTRWDWRVHYPINNYDVSLNIGNYVHFSDQLGDLPLDFYVLPEDLGKAKTQFSQAKGMIEAYQHYFGPYPFAKDGYKLIQAPYSGMEHQSAVTYGNLFKNGYIDRHQPALRLHHHPRERPRVVWQQHHRPRSRRHVDPRRLDHLPRKPLRRIPLGHRRRHQIPQRLPSQGHQHAPHRRRARRQRRPHSRPVLQMRSHAQHPAQRRR